jgi:hypothetical protein
MFNKVENYKILGTEIHNNCLAHGILSEYGKRGQFLTA